MARDILKHVIYFTGLSVLGALIYSNTLTADFHFDDRLTIINNPYIKNLSRLDILWLYDPSRFLTHISFGINYHFHRLDVTGFHLVNISLHILNTCLVFVFLNKILSSMEKFHSLDQKREWLSFIATLFFLVHPLQTQAVTYISQRATLLATACYLLALLFYMKNRETGRWSYYGCSLGILFIGVFTKPIIISLPFAILLIEFFVYDNRFDKKIYWAKWSPFLCTVLIVPVLLVIYKHKVFETGHIASITRETVKYTRAEYLFTQFNVIIQYFRMLFWPKGQNLDHDFPIAQSLFEWPTIGSFILLCALFSGAILCFSRRRILSFAVLWIFLTLALESSVFPISDVMNEHRMYLPMIGVGVLMSYGLCFTFRSRWMLASAVMVAVGIFSMLTYQRNFVWQDRIVMLEDIASKSKQKSRVFNNLGITHYYEGELDKAEFYYKKALELEPDFTHPMNNLANIYFRRKRYGEAKYWLEKAIEFEPDYAGAYYNLGNIALETKNVDEAEKYFIEAVNHKVGFVEAICALAKINAKRQDWERAEFFYRAAIDYDRGFIDSYVGLGDLMLNQRRLKEAAKYYQLALGLGSTPGSVYNSLANVYDMMGRVRESIAVYQEAIRQNPDYAHAYYNLAAVLKKVGETEEALEILAQAESLYVKESNPEMVEAVRRRRSEWLQ